MAVSLDIVVSSVPTDSRWKLDKVIDFEHSNAQGHVVPEHLGKIAESMINWEGTIADHLGLSEQDRSDIRERNIGKPELQRREALSIWKRRFGSAATYKTLIEVFIKSGTLEYAEFVCRLLNDITGTSADHSVEVNFTSDVTESAKKQDGMKIKTLEKKFLSLQKRLLAELKKDDSVTADILLGTLYILPVELQVEYRKFLDEKIPTLEQQGSVLTIFGQLSRHFTFLDYGLLGHLIEELGSEKLQQDMAAYVVSMEVFLDETSVQQLIDYWPGQRTTPPDFEELKAIVYQHPKLYSLRQLDDLRKNFCSETHLSQMVVVLKRVGKSNSFAVSWLVPSALASQLMGSLTQVGGTFYEKEFIYSITVNHQQLYCSMAMRETKVECEQWLLRLCTDNIGDIDGFSSLLSQPGVDPDIRDQHGRTLLVQVCYNGRTDIVQLLITYGANVDLPSEDGFTPLYAASQNGHTAVVSVLIDRGVTLDLPDQDGATPLHIAATCGQSDVANMLMVKGATVNYEDKKGSTPLMLASQDGHLDIARTLIHHGADVNHQNKNGLTGLTVASYNGHKDVVEALLRAGAKPDIQNQNGFNSLIMATKQGHTDIVATLLNNGANPNLQEKTSEWTPLHFAAKEGLEEIAVLLVNSGANVKLQDKNGVTPHNLARILGQEEVSKLLKNYVEEDREITENLKQQQSSLTDGS